MDGVGVLCVEVCAGVRQCSDPICAFSVDILGVVLYAMPLLMSQVDATEKYT